MTHDFELLRSIARRALAQMVAMVYRANHRDDVREGDPKVGGHPAACASCLEIHAALHLVVREPADFFCSKPHAAPMDHALFNLLGLFRHDGGEWFDDAEAAAVMDRLRSFPHDGKPVFQSYHAESDPDNWRILPSGSVGIPAVAAAYLALAYRYAEAHGWDVPQPHFWSVIGDSEFREGSLMEVLPEIAERELGNVTWIVDYNRQSLDGARTTNQRSLDGTDADRIERTCAANGWRAIQLRHGAHRKRLFEQPGGAALRRVLEVGLTDFHLQTLLWKNDAQAMREAASAIDGKCRKLLERLDDESVVRAFADLGGHDFESLVEALLESKGDPARPTMIIAHTIKGKGLRSSASTGNHQAIPDEEETLELLEVAGLERKRPYARFSEDSAEGRFLATRRAELRDGIEALERLGAKNRATVRDAIEAQGGLPESLDINLKLAPLTHTQWMWGQLAAKLVRIGVRDELVAAGKPAGKDLKGDEHRWNAVADLLLTLAPDVGTSTQINPAMDAKVFGPTTENDWETELGLRERLRPAVAPTDAAWSRHIRFDIAEANCMSATGSFGKFGDLAGIPFLPMMTVYDFFIKRALDQLYYDLYWQSAFIVIGTPSGITLSPEGAQHSWKSDIQMPNLITWEPSFAIEMDWILCDAIRRHFTGDNAGRTGVLIRAVTRALRQDLLIENLRRQARFKRELPDGAKLGASPADGGLPEAEVAAKSDAEIYATLREQVLHGGYFVIDYRGYEGYEPGENVVHLVTMGALAQEAIEASERLLERGIYANVLIASSPELLFGILGHDAGHRYLIDGLGIDGDLHLRAPDRPVDVHDAIDLAGRRIPIVSVHDGEEGLLDKIGSIVGVKQISLAVRKFSKSGTPADVYRYHGLDPDSIVEACGQALAETALETVRLSGAALAAIRRQQGRPAPEWKELWPDPAASARR